MKASLLALVPVLAFAQDPAAPAAEKPAAEKPAALAAVERTAELHDRFGASFVEVAWRLRRDEEGRYKSHLNYVDRKAESIALAKEVRIFGLAKWLEDVHTAALQAYEDFVARAKMRQLAADLVSVYYII